MDASLCSRILRGLLKKLYQIGEEGVYFFPARSYNCMGSSWNISMSAVNVCVKTLHNTARQMNGFQSGGLCYWRRSDMCGERFSRGSRVWNIFAIRSYSGVWSKKHCLQRRCSRDVFRVDGGVTNSGGFWYCTSHRVRNAMLRNWIYILTRIVCLIREHFNCLFRVPAHESNAERW